MKQVTLLLCLALFSLSYAVSPKPLIPESCKTTEFQAGLVLEEINKDRDDGYVLRLFRVVDAHRQPEGAGNVYYFTFDVLETECPVISGKSWKDCGQRSFHETVFGQCKAVIYLSLPWRRVRLYSYNCTLSTVPPGLIVHMCPDCPILERDLGPYVERAEKMAAKYNSESNNTHYFKVDKVERGSTQWMPSGGQGYFPEFSIKETNCSRLATDVSECEFLDDEKAHTGFCKGSVMNLPFLAGVDVTCEIYDPQKTGHPHHKHHGHDHHGHGHGQERGHDHVHGHQHGCGKGRKRHHHHHHADGHNHTHAEEGKHHHKGKHEHKHNGKPHKYHGSSSEEHTGPKPSPQPPAEPISSIQHIFMSSENDFFPIPHIHDPLPPAVPSGAPPAPGPVGPFRDPDTQPFPHVPSNSTDCPSEPKQSLPEIVKLLPVPK